MLSRTITPNAQSTQMDPQVFAVRLNSHKLPSTQAMVDEAIMALNSTRGFSLQKLKKYINEKYQIEMTPRRYLLIKDQLRVHISNGVLINITGRGLSGSLKLQSKAKRKTVSLSKDHHTTSSANEETVGRKRKKTTNKTKKSKAKSDKTITLTPDTPTNNQHHMRMVPDAPHRSSVTEFSQVERAESTPCSSGGRVGRRRKIMPAILSQVF